MLATKYDFDIVFNHDFLKSLDFEEAYPLVKEKYDRRIRRLLEKLKIVILCWLFIWKSQLQTI